MKKSYVMKRLFIYIFIFVILTMNSCTCTNKKCASRYQVAYDYINNCENLTFWRENICNEEYKDLFPINIVPAIYPNGGDASGFQPLINIIFNRNTQSNLYVIFSEEINNSIQAYCFQNDYILSHPGNYMLDSNGFPICNFSFTFVFNADNSINEVWHEFKF